MATTTTTTTEEQTAKLPELDMMGGDVGIDAAARYGFKRSPQRADYDRAIEIINDRLAQMTDVNAKLLVNMGDEFPEVFIDAKTSQPTYKTVAKGETKEKDTYIATTAQMIKRLYDGNLDARYALGLGFVRVLEGSRRDYIKFGDALTGFTQTHPSLKNINMSELPKPTEDIAKVKRDLDRWGYGFVKNALKPDELDRLRKRVSEARAIRSGCGNANQVSPAMRARRPKASTNSRRML